MCVRACDFSDATCQQKIVTFFSINLNPGPILSTYGIFLTHVLMPGAKSVEETFQSPFRDRDEHENATKNRDALMKTLVFLERDTWSASTSAHLKK